MSGKACWREGWRAQLRKNEVEKLHLDNFFAREEKQRDLRKLDCLMFGFKRSAPLL